MQRRILLAAYTAAFLLIAIGIGCTKLDTTTLGADLVTVDNVNTFADTLTVNGTQGIFNDSTILQKGDNHVIGVINNDPLFGKTDGRIYVQFKPTFYPFYFGKAGDTTRFDPNAGLDSAFVCLSYKGAWGDTSSTGNNGQTFEVRVILDDNFRIKTDTIRQLGSMPPTVDNSNLLGSANITPQIIAQKIILGKGANKDSVTNQIRIPLTGPGATFAATLFNGQDTLSTSPNNGFLNDSVFRKKYNGFEIRVKNGATGKTLYYVNLGEAKSRLEFHFHKTKAGVRDTVVQSFQMYTAQSGTIAASSSFNYIKRDYSSGTLPITNTATNDVFLQTSPGTFANLSIPGLTGYSNRIVHRAYLIVEQTPDNVITDNIFTPPPYLYLDLKDTALVSPQRYKPVYFDLTSAVPYNPDVTAVNGLYHPFPFGNVDIAAFGGGALKRFDPSGNAFYRYEINLTRYVQHIVSNGYKNYDLRLYAPFNYYYPQYLGTQYIIPFYNPIALGRVRVGTGSNLNHKMKLVVIYSKV